VPTLTAAQLHPQAHRCLQGCEVSTGAYGLLMRANLVLFRDCINGSHWGPVEDKCRVQPIPQEAGGK
jgi:hypothetical protein